MQYLIKLIKSAFTKKTKFVSPELAEHKDIIDDQGWIE